MLGMRGTIPNPCSKRFADMAGDERRRYCETCGTHVHAVELYSEAELSELGPICGYIGGTTEGPRQGRRAMLAGALLTTIAPLLAQEGRLRVVVKDESEAVVKGAEVSVGERKGVTDAAGEASFTGLAVGSVEVRAHSRGVGGWRGTYTVTNGAELRVEARLEQVTVGLFVPMVVATRSAVGRAVTVLVRDSSGSVVPDAEVVLGEGLHGRTDWAGIAIFPDLLAGERTLTVEKSGFATWRETRVVRGDERIVVRLVLRGQDVKVDVKESAGRRFWNWLSSCTRK